MNNWVEMIKVNRFEVFLKYMYCSAAKLLGMHWKCILDFLILRVHSICITTKAA